MKFVFRLGDELTGIIVLSAVLVFILILFSSVAVHANVLQSSVSERPLGDVGQVSPRIPKTSETFSCTAQKLLRPTGTGECK